MLDEMVTAYGNKFLMAAVGVSLALVCLFVVLKLLRGRASSPFLRGGRSRQPRLQVLDAAAVDARRRLVLVRRDNIEHLIMIGGPTDIVIESGIGEPRAYLSAEPVAVDSGRAADEAIEPPPTARQMRETARPEPRTLPQMTATAAPLPEPAETAETLGLKARQAFRAVPPEASAPPAPVATAAVSAQSPEPAPLTQTMRPLERPAPPMTAGMAADVLFDTPPALDTTTNLRPVRDVPDGGSAAVGAADRLVERPDPTLAGDFSRIGASRPESEGRSSRPETPPVAPMRQDTARAEPLPPAIPEEQSTQSSAPRPPEPAIPEALQYRRTPSPQLAPQPASVAPAPPLQAPKRDESMRADGSRPISSEAANEFERILDQEMQTSLAKAPLIAPDNPAIRPDLSASLRPEPRVETPARDAPPEDQNLQREIARIFGEMTVNRN